MAAILSEELGRPIQGISPPVEDWVQVRWHDVCVGDWMIDACMSLCCFS